MENDEKNVEVSLKGGGLDFSYKTSLQKAAHVIAFLSTGKEIQNNSGTVKTESVVFLGSNHQRSTGSPLDAIKQSTARTYPQKIAVLGKFLTERDNRETFDPKEILTLLRRMGDMPKNFTRDLKDAGLLGYVTEEPNNEYLLTEHGKQTVESKFQGAIAASSGVKKKSKKKVNNDIPQTKINHGE